MDIRVLYRSCEYDKKRGEAEQVALSTYKSQTAQSFDFERLTVKGLSQIVAQQDWPKETNFGCGLVSFVLPWTIESGRLLEAPEHTFISPGVFMKALEGLRPHLHGVHRWPTITAETVATRASFAADPFSRPQLHRHNQLSTDTSLPRTEV